MNGKIGPALPASKPRREAVGPGQEEQGLAALEAVDDTDEVAKIRRVLAERARRTRKGTARRHVLEHFEELVHKQVSPAGLAAETGLSLRAIQDAIVKETEAIRADLSAP